jgi:hypothetical protein
MLQQPSCPCRQRFSHPTPVLSRSWWQNSHSIAKAGATMQRRIASNADSRTFKNQERRPVLHAVFPASSSSARQAAWASKCRRRALMPTKYTKILATRN